MIAFLYYVLLMSFLFHCNAYDIFEGLGKQIVECFPLIHNERCNTSIYEAYTTETEQIGDNPLDSYFLLFTPTNQDKAEPLHKCGGKLPESSSFDPEIETIFVAHGWLDGVCRTAWMREIKTQLFIRGKYNVVLIDWTWGNTPDYAGAGQNSLVVGEQAAFVIQNIMDRFNLKGDKFHLIGHSFGSYLVGNAAKFIKDRNKENILRRLTFLDPAVTPVTEDDIENGKLSYKNAKFVDVIHSDGGTCFPFNIGLITPVGHADFYPNGGSVQLSCFEYGISTLLRLDLFYGLVSLIPMFCFHLQAIQYFKVSINSPKQFIGVQCNSYEEFLSGACNRCCQDNGTDCAVAGMDAEQYYHHKKESGKKRKYYFDTSLVCPYNGPQNFGLRITSLFDSTPLCENALLFKLISCYLKNYLMNFARIVIL